MSKKKCRECSKNLLFLSYYNIGGKLYCFTCYTQMLRRMNDFKKLPIGYGKLLRILEIMVRIQIMSKKIYSVKQLREIAIKEVEKMYYARV